MTASTLPNLSTLSDAQLEDLYNDCLLGDTKVDHTEAVILEILNNRPAFEPQTYDLQWELEDHGWNGGVTQEDRDAR